MKTQKRIRRPPPVRTQPIRNWSAIFSAAAPNGNQPRGGQSPAATMNDMVSKSVQLGYRVVDEYIRQGQRAAQRVNERSYDPGAMAGDLQQMAAQMGRFASDFAALWFELMRVAAPSGAQAAPGQSAPRRETTSEPDSGTTMPAVASGMPVQVKVEVASIRPAEVTLDLSAAAAGRHLVVEGLRSVDPKLPLLQGVTLASGADGDRILRVRVPNEHPPGVYNALILDADSSSPVGTVSIKIAAR